MQRRRDSQEARDTKDTDKLRKALSARLQMTTDEQLCQLSRVLMCLARKLSWWHAGGGAAGGSTCGVLRGTLRDKTIMSILCRDNIESRQQDGSCAWPKDGTRGEISRRRTTSLRHGELLAKLWVPKLNPPASSVAALLPSLQQQQQQYINLAQSASDARIDGPSLTSTMVNLVPEQDDVACIFSAHEQRRQPSQPRRRGGWQVQPSPTMRFVPDQNTPPCTLPSLFLVTFHSS